MKEPVLDSDENEIEKEYSSYEDWAFMPYISIKNELIRSIEFLADSINSSFKNKIDITTNFSFYKGDLILLGTYFDIIGTDFVLSILTSLAIENKISTAYISINSIDYESLGQKILSFKSRVSIKKIKNLTVRVDDIKKITKATEGAFESSFLMKCYPNSSFEQIDFYVEQMVADYHLDILVVDGLEFIKDLLLVDEEDYNSKLKEILEAFKLLAKKYNISILLTTEVSSEPKSQSPSLNDFKEKMIIPNVADMVLLLHNKKIIYTLEKKDLDDDEEEEWVLQRSSEGEVKSSVDEVELFIAKNKRDLLQRISLKRINHTGEFIFQNDN